MKSTKKEGPKSAVEILLIQVLFVMLLMRIYEPFRKREIQLWRQNSCSRIDFVLSVPIVPPVGVSPLPNSAKIYTSPRAGQQLECCQRSDPALGAPQRCITAVT